MFVVCGLHITQSFVDFGKYAVKYNIIPPPPSSSILDICTCGFHVHYKPHVYLHVQDDYDYDSEYSQHRSVLHIRGLTTEMSVVSPQ